jgi:hypothetical protein
MTLAQVWVQAYCAAVASGKSVDHFNQAFTPAGIADQAVKSYKLRRDRGEFEE